MKKRTYIAIDLKSFYASVECVERNLDPLTTNLVVADISRTDKTICLAVTPSLKAYGIPGRARLFEVIQKINSENIRRKTALCGKNFTGSSSNSNDLTKNPYLAIDYITAPPRMALYRKYSTEIISIYLKYVSIDDLYAYSIDEVFIDATPYLETYKMDSHDFTKMLIRDVLTSTGITATAGIAENIYLCKVALDITAKHIPADKDGVRIAELNTVSYRRTLWTHQKLTDFWMIGNGTAKSLNQHHLYTMGDIARCSVTNDEILYKEFGKNAQYIIDQAWGWEPVTIADIKSYTPETRSISSGQVLSRPYSFDETRIIVYEMSENIALELVEKSMMTDQIILQIGYDTENIKDSVYGLKYDGEIDTDRYGRKVPKPSRGTVNFGKYTSSSKLITEKVLEVFRKITNKDLLTRRINITANHILNEKDVPDCFYAHQFTFFDNPEETVKKSNNQMKTKKEKCSCNMQSSI